MQSVCYSYKWFNENAQYFDSWYNPKKFDFNFSNLLAEHCPEKFDIWFDPNTYNFQHGSLQIARCCSDKFLIWFDIDKFNYTSRWELVVHCFEHIDIWFDQQQFKATKIELQEQNLYFKMTEHMD
jgi:hypothetical protein